MEGFYLLCGHLLGDYILQNDWMASNKTILMPTSDRPCTRWDDNLGGGGTTPGTLEDAAAWDKEQRKGWTGLFACSIHCLLYTLAVLAFSWWWMPIWGVSACFVAHYAMDRYRLARKWMSLVGQEAFATGVLSPWSVIIVDNVIHILTLAAIAAVCLK